MDLEKKVKDLEEELKLYFEFGSILRRMVNPSIVPKLSDEDVERLKKELASMPASAVVVTESIPEIHHKVERPIVETDESTHEGRLLTVILKSTFFEAKRRVTAVAEELERVYAVKVTNTTRDLNPVLDSLVQKKILQREEASGGGWLYWLVNGAKERIKEA